MIRLLLLLFVALLLSAGIYLLKKPQTFFILMKKNNDSEKQQFLTQFGSIFIFLAIVGGVVVLLDRNFFSLSYILFILVLSTTFSILFAKKIY